MSIGDVWINDLEPAHRRGATTVLVGSRVDARATPTLRCASLEQLYPFLTTWVEPPHRTTALPTLETKVEK